MYGLGLEYEDRIGFTALLYALEQRSGPTDFAKILINAGANVVKRTSSGYTPLELAKENLKGPHPRIVSRKWQIDTVAYNVMSTAMTLEEDQEIYEYLLSVVRARQVSYGMMTASKSQSRRHVLICAIKANI